MNATSSTIRLSSLAFIYENMRDFPTWFQKLTPAQIEDIAKMMIRWQSTGDDRIQPMEEIEKREVLRAVMNCHGDAIRAAKALKIGKTTMYRKLKQWGYILEEQLLLAQASVLRGTGKTPRRQLIPTNDALSQSR